MFIRDLTYLTQHKTLILSELNYYHSFIKCMYLLYIKNRTDYYPIMFIKPEKLRKNLAAVMKSALAMSICGGIKVQIKHAILESYSAACLFDDLQKHDSASHTRSVHQICAFFTLTTDYLCIFSSKNFKLYFHFFLLDWLPAYHIKSSSHAQTTWQGWAWRECFWHDSSEACGRRKHAPLPNLTPDIDSQR